MFDRQFFNSKLGQASLASVAAMVAFVALSSQMQVEPMMAAAMPVDITMVEIA